MVEKAEIKQLENTPKQEKKQVWQIVEGVYGDDWKKMMPKLAAKFWICDEAAYIAAKKAHDKTKNIEYNIKIWEMLQKSKGLESEGIEKQINKFNDVNKQKFLRAHMDEFDQQYVMNMDQPTIDKLDFMEDMSLFGGFLRNQKESIQAKKDKIFSAGWFEKVNINQAAVNLELFEFDEDLIAFLARAKQEWYINTQDMLKAGAAATMKVNAASEEDIKNAWGKEALQRQLERMELLKMAKEKWLDQKYGAEFDDLAVRLYNIYKNDSRLQKFWDKDLLKYIEKVAHMLDKTKNTPKDALDKEKSKIIGTDVIQGYITEKESNLTTLVKDESLKDNEYRDNIKKKYDPTMGNMIKNICKGDEKFFDGETWRLKSDVSAKDRKRLDPKLKLIQNEFNHAEWEVLNVWNPTIKMQAVSTCIDMLRSCMNFSLDNWDKENLLTSLRIEKSDAIQEDDGDRIVEIKGKVGDKDLTVYYNLTKWTLETEKFLKKDIVKWIYYLANEENKKTCREEIPLLKLPKLSDFTQKVESRGDEWRKQILIKSENLDDMKKNLQTKLDTDVKADYLAGIDPSHFEKVAVQNMFTQEILIDFMHFPKGEGFEEIWQTPPEYFQLCDLVHNAANRYTRDELKKWRETIKEMKDIKEKRITYHPQTNPRDKTKQENNKERYFFEMAFCPYIVDKKNYRNMPPADNTYLKFFQCFKSPKSDSFPMIDLDMLGDYESKLEKLNKKSDNKMAWQRNQAFSMNMESMESQVGAETKMKEFENASDEKNVA